MPLKLVLRRVAMFHAYIILLLVAAVAFPLYFSALCTSIRKLQEKIPAEIRFRSEMSGLKADLTCSAWLFRFK